MMGKCWLPPLLACLFAACAHSEEPSPLTVVAVGATGVGSDIGDDARKARDRSRLFDVVFQAVQENHGSKYTNKQFERVQGVRSKLSQRISKLPADLQELPHKLMDDLRLGRTSEERVEAAIKGEEQKTNQRAKDHEEQRKQQEAQKQREEDLRRQEGDLRRMMEEHLQRERDRMQQELQLERERQDKEDARARDALWWTAVVGLPAFGLR